VVTGVLDQGSWYWWDRVQQVFAKSDRSVLETDIGGERFVATLGTAEQGRQAARRLIERLKRVSDPERLRAITEIERLLGVELPAKPPAEFAPMTWEDVRRSASGGVSYGPHTITHPIMSQLDDASARQQLEGSLSRLREQTSAAVPIFCYPNGGAGDISPREPANLRLLGFESAVTSCVGYATAADWHSSSDSPFLLPRFGYNGNPALFKQIVTGVLRARLAIRRGAGTEKPLATSTR
jgi:peptidoglycan/xylan/chitin deacetylase (PgdA/CDA1 family)